MNAIFTSLQPVMEMIATSGNKEVQFFHLLPQNTNPYYPIPDNDDFIIITDEETGVDIKMPMHKFNYKFNELNSVEDVQQALAKYFSKEGYQAHPSQLEELVANLGSSIQEIMDMWNACQENSYGNGIPSRLKYLKFNKYDMGNFKLTARLFEFSTGPDLYMPYLSFGIVNENNTYIELAQYEISSHSFDNICKRNPYSFNKRHILLVETDLVRCTPKPNMDCFDLHGFAELMSNFLQERKNRA